MVQVPLSLLLKRESEMLSFFDAQDRQANGCLHTDSFAGRKDMEHEVRNVCVHNRVGVSSIACIGKMVPGDLSRGTIC